MKKTLKIMLPIASMIIILSLIIVISSSEKENTIVPYEEISLNDGDVLSIESQTKEVFVSFLTYDGETVYLFENDNKIDSVNIKNIIGENRAIQKENNLFFIGKDKIANVYYNQAENTIAVDILGSVDGTSIKDVDRYQDEWFLAYNDKLTIRNHSSLQTEDIDIKLNNIKHKDGFIYGVNDADLVKISVETKKIETTDLLGSSNFTLFGDTVFTTSLVDETTVLVKYDAISLTPLDIVDVKSSNANILGFSGNIIYLLDKENVAIKTVDLIELKPLIAYDISSEIKSVENILDSKIENSIISILTKDNVFNYSLIEKNKEILSEISLGESFINSSIISIK